MTSTYVEVFPRLKREERPRDAAVEKAKQELSSLTSAQVATTYAEWRRTKADLEGELKAVNVQLKACEWLLIDSEEAEAEEWGAYGAAPNVLRRPNGDKLEVRTEINVKTVDPDAIREWFKKEGLERMLTINARTLAAHVKKMLLNGDAEPPGTEATTWKKIYFYATEKK